MEFSDARKLKGLEAENARLKKLLAESMLDVSTPKEMLAKKLLTPGARHAAVNWAITEQGCSQRRACLLVRGAPKTYRCRSGRGADDDLRARLRVVVSERRRFCMRERGGRKPALGTRAPMALQDGPSQRWALDFVSDALASNQRFHVLAVVDDFTRKCLGLVVDTSLSRFRVVRELDRIASLRGYPAMIVSDDSAELTSHAILHKPED